MENSKKEHIEKAGAIVLSDDDNTYIALIYRAKEKDWSFPKGHINKGESPSTACVREVKEEIGLDVDILIQLPNNEYSHNTGKKIITYMYLTRSKGGDFIIEHPGDKIEWVDIKEVENRLIYDSLKKYYNKILPTMEAIGEKQTYIK